MSMLRMVKCSNGSTIVSVLERNLQVYKSNRAGMAGKSLG